jgi:hypothetical protein
MTKSSWAVASAWRKVRGWDPDAPLGLRPKDGDGLSDSGHFVQSQISLLKGEDMRLKLAVLSAMVVGFLLSVTNAFALTGDTGVLSTSPFRLNPTTLEPACQPASELVGVGLHVQLGDTLNEVHLSVPDAFEPGGTDSVKQVLVPGLGTGYKAYSSFDTGTSASDPDIDPGQTATGLFAPPGHNVDLSDVIVCLGGHADTAANSNVPYVEDHSNDANDPFEVAAVNRPIIQPAIAALGVSAIEPLNTFKVGFGYSDPQWFNAPLFGLSVTDPMSALDAVIPSSIVSLANSSGINKPGVLHVNDFDKAIEAYHGSQVNWGQTVQFLQTGDPTAFLNDDLGILTFNTQGDLPFTWSVKPSLAPNSYKRSVTLSDDFLRNWDAQWQAYYQGTGPKPTLPLAPGTNSPAPEPGNLVNPPVQASDAPRPQSTSAVTVSQSVSKSCVSSRRITLKMSKRATAARVVYVGANGKRTVRAHSVRGILKAIVDLRGRSAKPGTYTAVRIQQKVGKHWRTNTRVFKLC